jgi:type I restriction enzyme, S subunit
LVQPVDIRPVDLKIVQTILRDTLPRDVRVWVFGSRAKWTTKDSSDLDIAIDAGRALTRNEQVSLADSFEESDLPYKVDFVDLNTVSESFKEIIERDKAPLPQTLSGGMRDWQTLVLGSACSKIGSGATPKGGKEVYLGGDTSLIRSQNIHNDHFSDNGLVYINDNQAEELKNVVVQKNDVLLNITGDSVARCCQVDPKVLPARVNQHVAIIRPKPDILDARFLRYYLVSPFMQDRLLGLASAGATRNALTKSMIESLDIRAPSLKEQKAIAAVLGALDDKIELNRRMNATLEATARALFKSWFVDFDPVRAKMEGKQPFGMDAATAALFPSRLVPSPLGDIPEGWEVKQFKDAANFYNSKRVPLSSREREQRKGSYRYFGATSVMDYVDNYLFDGTYVLVGEDGSVITEKGFPFLQYVWGKFWVNNHAHVLQGKNGWPTEAIYLILAQSNIQHLVTGAVQPKLSMGNLSALKFASPSSQITTAFCDQIAVFFEKIKAISNENVELERTRDYLLPKLISGDIRIPDAEKFVEAA